jgi:transcriptional regulator of acetoin/glycerol metabolism
VIELRLDGTPRPPAPQVDGAVFDDDQPSVGLDERRKQRLLELLREHAGNISKVARAIGKPRPTIHRWLKQYGLDPNAFRR